MAKWKEVLVIAAVVFAPLAASAEERLLILRPEKTSVTFKLKATGHEVNGVLALEVGQIRFDSATGAASGQITIDLRRAETGNGLRDREMHRAVLETERYPQIVFRPERLEGVVADSGVSNVVLLGTVVLHGDEHKLRLQARIKVADERVSAEVTFGVPYVEWGLHDPSFLVLRVAPVVAVTVLTEGVLSPTSTAVDERGAPLEVRSGKGTRDGRP
jgi:polyisoprenoid-binding protein YceI